MRQLQFWFEFASTYSYPAALRIEEVCARAGVQVVYEPFLLGPIFNEQGWQDSPFNIYPAKGRYMWRDLERITERQAIPFRRPSTFPRSGLTAARIACAARTESWLSQFVRKVYIANFAEDREVNASEVLGEVLTDLGLDADVWLGAAALPENKVLLRHQTERAISLGIFGAPSFVSGTELFWGNDRLEHAIEHVSG